MNKLNMNKLKRLSLLFGICLMIMMTQAAWSQDSVKIYATDGTTWQDSLWIGTHTSTTDCIDASLGEFEAPPSPPTGIADFRSVNIPGMTCLGQGLQVKDIRGIVRQTESDTFKLCFKSSTEGGSITLSWPSNIGSIGEGYWNLKDASGLGLFSDVDMTTTTSFTYPFTSTSNQYVYIIKGDGYKMRSFRADSIALALDSKGKAGKAEKAKPSFSEWTITFTNTTGIIIDKLNAKFSQKVTSFDVTGDMTASPVLPNKTIDFIGTLNSGEWIVVHGFGDKGKSIKVTATWYAGSGKLAKFKLLADPGTEILLYKTPNINNIGYEVYPKNGSGLLVGLSGNNNSILHAKWSDVIKTMNSKGILHDANPSCLDTYGGKPFKKPLKKYEPKKQKNTLVGEAVALKLNIAASAAGKNPSGFGQLKYIAQPGDPALFDDMTVSAIAETLDSFMSTCGGSYTLNELLTVVQNINNSASGPFEVESFGPSGTIASGATAMALNQHLYRASSEIPPVIAPIFLYSDIFPEQFELKQNYPNPFNPTTAIEFDLTEDALVTIKVYNMLGQEVATLAENDEFVEGVNDVDFNASRLTSGVYFYRLVANSVENPDLKFQQVRKMMLMK
ncbi:MAG TPA: T9SS type A sorting domain-containing protein [Bacteroidota bacterium]|nr:T9SS type A sorting domain-containing protein [Bacteroidota bacterium]